MSDLILIARRQWVVLYNGAIPQEILMKIISYLTDDEIYDVYMKYKIYGTVLRNVLILNKLYNFERREIKYDHPIANTMLSKYYMIRYPLARVEKIIKDNNCHILINDNYIIDVNDIPVLLNGLSINYLIHYYYDKTKQIIENAYAIDFKSSYNVIHGRGSFNNKHYFDSLKINRIIDHIYYYVSPSCQNDGSVFQYKYDNRGYYTHTDDNEHDPVGCLYYLDKFDKHLCLENASDSNEISDIDEAPTMILQRYDGVDIDDLPDRMSFICLNKCNNLTLNINAGGCRLVDCKNITINNKAKMEHVFIKDSSEITFNNDIVNCYAFYSSTLVIDKVNELYIRECMNINIENPIDYAKMENCICSNLIDNCKKYDMNGCSF